jgi:hypothetical protein
MVSSYDPAKTGDAPMLRAGDQRAVAPRSIVVLRGPLPDST